jgi:hypothetical protein
MRWRSLFSRKTEAFDYDALVKLLTSDALYNRAALNPETLRLYHEMFRPAEPGEAEVRGAIWPAFLPSRKYACAISRETGARLSAGHARLFARPPAGSRAG